MILMTGATPQASLKRETLLKNKLHDEYHGHIDLKREQVKLCPSMKSTRKGKTKGNQLAGEIWEVSYCE